MIEEIQSIISGERDPQSYSADELGAMCALLNERYRAGDELVSDAAYDALFIGPLKSMAPDHPFLHNVEPEQSALGVESVRHEAPMLSTDKAYSVDEIERFFARVAQVGRELGQPELTYRATPKLDGIAGMLRSDGRLVTRGDGLKGSDITHAFDRGMTVTGERQPGAGEIVLEQRFFEQEIESQFNMRHPRNFIAGFVAADTVKAHHKHAAQAGAVRFCPYTDLPAWEGTAEDFLQGWESICQSLRDQVPYLTDGVVLEAANSEVKAAMGATSHHHRWQVAVKTRGEVAQTTVRNVRLQTGRTGRVTPVLEIEPVHLSGAEISNVTAHTAATLQAKGLGVGAVVEITRAGDVIPKLERVITPAETPMHVDACPSCGHELETEGEYKVCPNSTGCPAQAESRLKHFFHTLGTADLFGPATVKRLIENGHTELPDIYRLRAEDYQQMGFGPGQSRNLVEQVERSLAEPVQDWRFLAAFGIRHLGRGDARKLLTVHPITEVGNLSPEQIEAIPGFGAITAPAIAERLSESWPTISQMLAFGFNLEHSQPSGNEDEDGVLSGEHIVFTGKMTEFTREEMEADARTQGAQVQSSVNGKTTILVCGEKAGSKRKKAEALNEKAGKTQVRILDEAEYLALLETA